MPQKKKILHIIKSLGRGGAEMLLPETLKKHNQGQYEFHYIYFLPWKNQMVKEIRDNGGIITCFSANNNFQILAKLRLIFAYVKDHKINLIHCHLPWAGIVGRLVGRLARVPVVYTEHNKWERYHKLTYWLNRVTFGMQRAAVAVSGDVEQSIRKHAKSVHFQSLVLDHHLSAVSSYSLSPSAPTAEPAYGAGTERKDQVLLCTILNGVNTLHFQKDTLGRRDVREDLGIPADAPVVGTVAVFRFQKRLDLWLEVAAGILRKVPEAHFIIVGDGPLKMALLQKRNELGLEKRVHMVGLQTDVKPYFNSMDLFMMTSIFEGLPIALLEAMSCSCAVISTAAGGIGQVIQNGESGYTCAVDAYGDLEEMAVRLLTDDEERERMAEGARVRVQESFSIEKMVDQLEQLYERIGEE